MSIPEKVLRLIEHFKEHREDKRDPGYKEARLRVEFLDDFFEALGWDMTNSQGYSEAYQDVVVEELGSMRALWEQGFDRFETVLEK